jgi:hypothetical protein
MYDCGMMIKTLLILFSVAFAQSNLNNFKVDQRVNEHLQKTNKKMEIEGKRKEVELRKDAPENLQPETPIKKKTPFIVHPQKPVQDPTILRDQYDQNAGKDPSTEFEQDIIQERDTPPGMTNEEYVRQFKANAAKAGVKVEVDPKTLKARPVHTDGTN